MDSAATLDLEPGEAVLVATTTERALVAFTRMIAIVGQRLRALQ